MPVSRFLDLADLVAVVVRDAEGNERIVAREDVTLVLSANGTPDRVPDRPAR